MKLGELVAYKEYVVQRIWNIKYCELRIGDDRWLSVFFYSKVQHLVDVLQTSFQMECID